MFLTPEEFKGQSPIFSLSRPQLNSGAPSKVRSNLQKPGASAAEAHGGGSIHVSDPILCPLRRPCL